MTNPIAIVTGAASGLGRATAELLAKEYALLLCDISEHALEDFRQVLTQSGVQVQAAICDVSKQDQVVQAVDAAADMGKIEAVFHAAGVSPTMADVGKPIYEINLLGTAYLLDALATHLQEGASVVLVSSMASYFSSVWTPDQLIEILRDPLADDFYECLQALDVAEDVMSPGIAYGLSKLGVRCLAEKTAQVWGPRNIRVNTISPGIIDTPMAAREAEKQPSMQMMKDVTPLQRVGKPREIAQAGRFLLSPDASFITGADLLVDGGSTRAIIEFMKSTPSTSVDS